MYCKKCGKQIADDSAFCQYCGEAQSGKELTKDGENKKRITLTNKSKIWIGVYAVWFLLNMAAIFLESTTDYLSISTNYFYPWGRRGKWVWDVSSYDISEFIVYAFIVPIVLYGIYLFGRKHNWWNKCHKFWKWFVSSN